MDGRQKMKKKTDKPINLSLADAYRGYTAMSLE